MPKKNERRALVSMSFTVTFDPDRTNPESLASALDTLIDTALYTSGILDDYGSVQVSAIMTGSEARLISE